MDQSDTRIVWSLRKREEHLVDRPRGGPFAYCTTFTFEVTGHPASFAFRYQFIHCQEGETGWRYLSGEFRSPRADEAAAAFSVFLRTKNLEVPQRELEEYMQDLAKAYT